ncbi:putative beta-lysine N-acetyltransferase [Aquimarina sp. M1]
MFDVTEKINGALLHHGAANNRVYLMQADHDNWDLHLNTIRDVAIHHEYDKILGVVPEDAKETFVSSGFKVEAKIPNLYKGTKDGYFLADFLSKERFRCDEQKLKIINSVKTIALASNSTSQDAYISLPDDFEIRKLEIEDLETLSDFNKKVFKKYPFPIFETSYLQDCLQGNYEFYGLFEKGTLIVTANLKLNREEWYAEIVDFATHPSYRGQNLSYYLVQFIIQSLEQKSFRTLYSLVRATSYGLNITLCKHGFLYGGMLTNNSRVKEVLESMNVWYLSLKHNVNLT